MFLILYVYMKSNGLNFSLALSCIADSVWNWVMYSYSRCRTEIIKTKTVSIHHGIRQLTAGIRLIRLYQLFPYIQKHGSCIKLFIIYSVSIKSLLKHSLFYLKLTDIVQNVCNFQQWLAFFISFFPISTTSNDLGISPPYAPRQKRGRAVKPSFRCGNIKSPLWQ